MPGKMGQPETVITDVPTEMALRQAEIQATRTLTESVNRLTDRMDSFGQSLGDIRDKVTTIEARDYGNQIIKLEGDTDKAIEVLHASNRTRDSRLNMLEQQMAKFGAYVAVAGAIGGCALGVIATKVFGGG